MSGALGRVGDFAVYYGTGGEQVLSRYDLAVVEPAGRGPQEIASLKSGGGLALAYLSVLERAGTRGEPAPAGVLAGDGRPVFNEQFGNWVLDPRDEGVRRRVLELAAYLLSQGYDGLFLDTLADLEDFALPPALRGECVLAAARLVADLAKSRRCVLVQNRGFHQVLPVTARHLDGVCWEDFPYERIGRFPARYGGVRMLQTLERANGMRVLALNEGVSTPKEARSAQRVARRCGFPWYGTPRYTDLPPTDARGGGEGRVAR